MTTHQYAPNLFRNGLINQAGRKRRTSNELAPGIGDYVPLWSEQSTHAHKASSRPLHPSRGNQQWARAVEILRAWNPRDLLGVPLVLIIIWMVVLWWGEEAIFRRKVEDCVWDRSESWVGAAQAWAGSDSRDWTGN